MPDSPVDPHYSLQLRGQAESVLKNGNAPAGRGHVLGTDALSVLFKLASSSESATDGLKLLHELQTYQIELDLLLEQFETNERETAVQLARYKALYEFSPVAYFIISREGHISESNRAGAALFGLDHAELDGQALDKFLPPDNREAFNRELRKLFNGPPGESCTVALADSNEAHPLRITASLSPAGDVVLMTISEQERPA